MISSNEMRNFFERMIRPLKNRVMLIIGRAVVAAVSDSKGMQSMKLDLLSEEVQEDVERFQEYGFTSVPFPGAEAVSVFVGGNRDHGIVIAVDDRRYRLKALEPGEVALYTDEGDKIHLKRNNTIEVLTTNLVVTCQEADVVAETMAVIDSPLVDIISDEVNIGDGALEKVLKGETFQATFNAHTHVGNAGVSTSPPQVPSGPSDLSTIVSEA